MHQNLNPVPNPNNAPLAVTAIAQKVAANLAGLADALQDLEPALTGYVGSLPPGGIASADHDLLSSGIRRLEGSTRLDPSRSLEQGYMYAELPSAGYNDLRLRVTYLDSKPNDFFVRQMGHPQNGAAEFYSMKVEIDASGGTLYFADTGSEGMLESSDWQRAEKIVEDMRSAVISLADKLNRSDISQRLQ